RGRPDVAAVAHPLLDDHPDHAVARRLLAGGSGMVTATLAGDPDRGRRVLGGLRLIAHAASLGGIESIACLPAATSHAAVPEAERRRQGIEQNTIRLSLGIEDAEDLIDDIGRALDRSAPAADAPEERCAQS
ncbi:MAG TPA: PLP-dependent transferase, partial [Gemmatimonadaceae bacterium]|nr:PLP-dependent transferase [Gemmatimonadaceae bacterium]